MHTLQRAVLFSYLEKYGVFVLSLVASMVLSRLLTPAEVGTFSVGAVVVGLAGMLRDFGAGTYIVQTPELTDQKLRTAFTIAFCIGAALALVLAVLAVPLSIFYKNPGVRDVLWILALNFLLIPFGSTTQALLARDLRFDAIAKINVTAAVTSSTVSIGMAWRGIGFTSLAWGVVAAAAVTAFLCSFYRRPGLSWWPSFGGMRDVAKFGGYTTGTQIANEMVVGAPDLALAKLSGFESAGEFSRANGLAQAFQQTVLRGLWPVLVPYFSKAKREGQPLGGAYLVMVQCATAVGWPFFLMLAVLAHELVVILFGVAWLGSVNAVQMLALGGAVWVAFSFAIPALVAAGDAREGMRASLFSLPVRLGLIGLGALAGPATAAGGAAAGALVLAALVQRALAKSIGVGWRDILPGTVDSLKLASVTICIPLALSVAAVLWPSSELALALNTESAHTAIAVVLAQAVVGAVCFTLLLRTLDHPLRTMALRYLPRPLTVILQ